MLSMGFDLLNSGHFAGLGVEFGIGQVQIGIAALCDLLRKMFHVQTLSLT